MELTQEQKIANDLIEAMQPLIDAIKEIWKSVKEIFIKLWNSLKTFINDNQKASKYIRIYNRTHSQRIKKKQITKIIRLWSKYEE